jgi:hypothetical protein
MCYVDRDKGDYKGTKAGYTELYIFICKEGQTAHVLDGSTAKSFHFSTIRPAAAAQMHADEQAERICADGITAMVALRSGTAEYAPLRNRLSDRNCGQGNEQDNVQGNIEENDGQATQRRTMLKTSMIRIILPQPSTRYCHACRAQQHEQL